MLITAIVLFVIAAFFGLILLKSVLRNQPTPKPAVFAHGLIAAAGLVLLLYYVITHAEKLPIASLIVFVIAALGGFVMFFMDMSKKPIPKGIALIHAAAAVIGLVLLLLFTFGI